MSIVGTFGPQPHEELGGRDAVVEAAMKLAVFQLENQNCPGKDQRDGVGHNEWNISNYESVCEPKQDASDEYREHPK